MNKIVFSELNNGDSFEALSRKFVKKNSVWAKDEINGVEFMFNSNDMVCRAATPVEETMAFVEHDSKNKIFDLEIASAPLNYYKFGKDPMRSDPNFILLRAHVNDVYIGFQVVQMNTDSDTVRFIDPMTNEPFYIKRTKNRWDFIQGGESFIMVESKEIDTLYHVCRAPQNGG